MPELWNRPHKLAILAMVVVSNDEDVLVTNKQVSSFAIVGVVKYPWRTLSEEVPMQKSA